MFNGTYEPSFEKVSVEMDDRFENRISRDASDNRRDSGHHKIESFLVHVLREQFTLEKNKWHFISTVFKFCYHTKIQRYKLIANNVFFIHDYFVQKVTNGNIVYIQIERFFMTNGESSDRTNDDVSCK